MFEFFKELGPVLREEIKEVNRATGVSQFEYTAANDGRVEGTEAGNAKRENGKEKEIKEKRLLSTTTRTVIVVMGIIFLVSQVAGVFSVIQSDMGTAMKTLVCVKAILLCADVIATFICLKIKGRKAEILALVGVGLFIVLQYFSTAMMVYI